MAAYAGIETSDGNGFRLSQHMAYGAIHIGEKEDEMLRNGQIGENRELPRDRQPNNAPEEIKRDTALKRSKANAQTS